MQGLPLVRDSSTKTGCVTVDIRSDGEVRAFNHGGGFIIPVFQGSRTNCMQFMQNQDQRKLRKWTIGLASTTSFHKMSRNCWIEDIHLILLRGLFYCTIAKEFKIVFHRWKGKGCMLDIGKDILHFENNPLGFVQAGFESSCCVVSVNDIFITYLNQITGQRLSSWTTRPRTFEKNSLHYYKSGKQPDYWCDQDPFPESTNYPFLIMPPKTKCAQHFLKKSERGVFSTADLLCGSPKLHQIENSMTRVIYVIRQDFQCKLGTFLNKPYLQTCYTPPDSEYELFAPISTHLKKTIGRTYEYQWSYVYICFQCLGVIIFWGVQL